MTAPFCNTQKGPIVVWSEMLTPACITAPLPMVQFEAMVTCECMTTLSDMREFSPINVKGPIATFSAKMAVGWISAEESMPLARVGALYT